MDIFERELRAAQRSLLDFIGILGGTPGEAEDILGEANLAILRERAHYDPSRPFMLWARQFAANAIKRWRTRSSRSRLVFDDALMDSLAAVIRTESAEDHAAVEELWLRRAAVLEEAKKELTPEMQYLLTRHYTYGDSLAAIGRQLNREPHSVAVSLHYIRGVLKKSVAKKLTEDDNV